MQLALAPLAAAIAAGNAVMLKPSEYTPRTSDLLAGLCGDVFERDVVSVIRGGAEVGEAFVRRLLNAAYGISDTELADLRRVGFRILPQTGNRGPLCGSQIDHALPCTHLLRPGVDA